MTYEYLKAMRGGPGQDLYDGLNNLCIYVRSISPKEPLNIIEVGSYSGESTEIIAKNFPNSSINCVDIWEKYVEDCSVYSMDIQELELKEAEHAFDERISKYKKIKKNKMPSIEFAKTVPEGSLDFIYIDGNHQYSSVKEDILTWMPKIKKGGVLSGHDFNWPSVQKAMKEIFEDRQADMTFVDSSWAFRL